MRLELPSGLVQPDVATKIKRLNVVLAGVLAIALVLIATIGAHTYLQGGGRVTMAFGFASGPVAVGEEFHFIVPVATEGTVRLRSATVTSGMGGATVTTQLVHLRPGAAMGTSIGTLSDDYEVLALVGQRIPDTGDDTRFALDISVVGERPGVHRLSPVRVTYESGQFRQRTATMESPGCVEVRAEIGTTPSTCQ